MLVNRTNFDECLVQLTSDRLVVDCETTGLKAYARGSKPADAVAGVAVKSNDRKFYFPVRHSGGKNIEFSQYQRLLRRLESALIVNHNTGFDLHMMALDGFAIPKHYIDTLPGTHLYNENESHRLKAFAEAHLGKGSAQEQEDLHKVLHCWGYGPDEMWRLPPEMVEPYACQDVQLADDLDAWLRANLYRPELYDEMNDFGVLLDEMSHRGMWVNRTTLATLRREAMMQSMRWLQEIQALAGRPLNPGSNPQVSSWLRLPNAQDETLALVKSPGAEAIRNFRAWNKAVNTYYDRYPELVDQNWVLHPRIRIDGTVSGRLSCSDPNLHAVPRFCEEQKVKQVFEAREGKVLAELDFSQAEMRVAVHYTGEKALMEMFQKNQDTHTMVAKQLNVPRQVGKTINFSVIYGIGAGSLAQQLNVKESVAGEFLGRYHDAYRGFRSLTKKAKKAGEVRGYIETYTGRRAHFNTQEASPRLAFSRLIQGSVADMVRRVMMRVKTELPEAVQLMQVHDSLILELDKDGHERDLVLTVKSIMEDQDWCRTPIKADAKMGQTWASMKPVEE